MKQNTKAIIDWGLKTQFKKKTLDDYVIGFSLEGKPVNVQNLLSSLPTSCILSKYRKDNEILYVLKSVLVHDKKGMRKLDTYFDRLKKALKIKKANSVHSELFKGFLSWAVILRNPDETQLEIVFAFNEGMKFR